MSSIQPFQFDQFVVRTLVIDDQPMFHARDVATALGYENPSKAYQDHCKRLKLLSYNESLELNFPNPNPRGEYVIPESDVYRLVLRSKLESAERFQDWVCEDVLPAIRKTGSYSTPKPKQRLDSAEAVRKALQEIASIFFQYSVPQSAESLDKAIDACDNTICMLRKISSGLSEARLELDKQAEVLASLRFPCTLQQDRAQVYPIQQAINSAVLRMIWIVLPALSTAFVSLCDFDAVRELRRRIP